MKLRTVPVPLSWTSPRPFTWPNQIELYFSIVKPKALTPLDFPSKADISWRLALFEGYYNAVAAPLRWRYRREDLAAYVKKLTKHEELFRVPLTYL